MKTFPDFPRFILASFRSAVSRNRTTNCIWELTYRCNAQCEMCSYWRDPTLPDQELTLSEIWLGVDRIRASGCRFVNFSGGEPTLREDLEEIVTYASEKRLWTSIVTNGSLLDRSRIVRLKRAGLDNLFISLDFADAQKHDRMRGIPGLHQRVVELLPFLDKVFATGHRTAGIMWVISQLNVAELDALVQLAHRSEVYIVFQLYHARKVEEDQLGVKDVSEVVSKLLALKKRYGNLISSRSYLAGMLAYQSGTMPVCQTGRKYFSIDPYGGLHPCVDLPAVGDMLRDEVSVIRSPEATKWVQECSGCWYCFRGEADASTSVSGCFDKMCQHLGIMARNTRRQYGRRQA